MLISFRSEKRGMRVANVKPGRSICLYPDRGSKRSATSSSIYHHSMLWDKERERDVPRGQKIHLKLPRSCLNVALLPTSLSSFFTIVSWSLTDLHEQEHKPQSKSYRSLVRSWFHKADVSLNLENKWSVLLVSVARQHEWCLGTVVVKRETRRTTMSDEGPLHWPKPEFLSILSADFREYHLSTVQETRRWI